MMREIKFRAWIKRPYNLMVQPEEITSMSLYCGKIIYAESDEHDMDKGTFELMQYTGLKDKNGTEIYEGDIVRVRNGATTRESYFVGDVVFEKGEFGQRAVKYEGAYPPYMFTANDVLPIKNSKLIEVIGNIYENATLLKETEG